MILVFLFLLFALCRGLFVLFVVNFGFLVCWLAFSKG